MASRFHRRHRTASHSGWDAGFRGERSAGALGFLRFDDRRLAGRVLAEWLMSSTPPDAVVVGVAGGGTIVAEEVAQTLGLPLDVIVIEPVALPGLPGVEAAALAADGTMESDVELLNGRRTSPAVMEAAIQRAHDRVARRAGTCRAGAAPVDLEGRTVVVVDDALGSGIVTATAAASARRRGADRIIVAAPVGDRHAVECAGRVADEVIVVLMPAEAGPRTRWYCELPPVPDADVAEILAFRYALD
jgi:predicted phosphoribosyltransferase